MTALLARLAHPLAPRRGERVLTPAEERRYGAQLLRERHRRLGLDRPIAERRAEALRLAAGAPTLHLPG